MIILQVDAPTGHYRIPGQVAQSEVAPTYPIAPPSTVKGFLESLAGSAYGTFKGSFSYGWIKLPSGRGQLTRRVHVWASPGEGIAKSLGRQGVRTVVVDTLIDLSYIVTIEGEWETKIRAAINGDVNRFGVLYLGESSDMVNIRELEDIPGETLWVTEGSAYALPVKSGRGYSDLSATYRSFDIRSNTTPALFE